MAALLIGLGAADPGLAIVGPSEVAPSLADRVVTLLSKGPEGSGYCTGVVLAPTVLLTAAHCLRAPRDLAALTRGADGAPVLWPIDAIERHPGYRADAVAARRVSIDAALVRLKSPLGAGFRAVALSPGAQSQPAVGDELLLAGVGETRRGEPNSGGVLRRARLRVRAPLSSVLLWADGGEAQVGACSGDSGAPLFAADGALLAIVAWADGGDRRGCGGVTQGPLIAPMRAWIESVMRRWGAR